MSELFQSFLNSIAYFTSLELVQFLGVLAVVCAILSLLYALAWR
jgi:hypothetical protein